MIIAFSIIFVFILLIITLLPSVIAGPEIAANFRYITLLLLIFIAIILICLIVYFILNYRLLSLLEREDWPALAYYLEQKIFVKGGYDTRKVRLLASSYMVISDYTSVLRLENKAALAKPSVVEKNVLIFGPARILGGNYADAAAFFKSYLENGRLKADEREWVRWFYGFSNLLGGDFARAEPDFSFLAQYSRDTIIIGLSAYFLSKSLARNSKNPDECRAASEKGRERVEKAVKNAAHWKKEVRKMETEIHAAIIRKYIDEAEVWLFKKGLE
jgi:hypothetical protein